jgi:isoleucyl-tRNA synthetase
MGVHHAWGRTYKDTFQRFKAMQGYELRWQSGFDCQGLWVEVEVEKALGFKSKLDIARFGVAEFVKQCKQRALRFAAVQTEQSIRLGYWMDWDSPAGLRMVADALDAPETVLSYEGTTGIRAEGHPEQVAGALGRRELGGSYFTMSDENNYAIWAFLKECHQNGWLYKGRDVMPWCPRCATGLSEHELATEGYAEVTHTALTVKFPLRGHRGEALLVWTTTPWTLTSNVVVAANPASTYARVEREGESLWLAKAAVARIFGADQDVLEERTGQQLSGLEYEGPFDELEAVQAAEVAKQHRVVMWDDVVELEGTGFVHVAPGAGKEDFELGRGLQLPSLSPLDETGLFGVGFGEFTGTHVYDSASLVVDLLQAKNLLLKTEEHRHRYPVCWRCGSELVFRLVDEWFVSMGAKSPQPTVQGVGGHASLRQRTMSVASEVRWLPPHGLAQELEWLRNMGDWMISKKRFWGLALPVWECAACGGFEVVGSRGELKARAAAGWSEFEGHSPHRPWIDRVKLTCSRCGQLTSRISDVGNPWLDAGIVAYSTLGYFSDRGFWEQWFPADLVCEALPGQFRNWFYSLLTMSAVLGNTAPCRTCFGHGLVLAENGTEMHKSAGNAVWFDDAVESMGADVMRWMYLRAQPATSMRFGSKPAEEVRRTFLIPLWNVYSFFVTYANLDHWVPHAPQPASPSALDRWILSRLQTLTEEVTRALENFNPAEATVRLERFVDDLSRWYLRRSRRRFWKSETDSDKHAAYSTLYTTLTALVTLLAPFIPFMTEEMYQNLVRSVNRSAQTSVHHQNWPTPNQTLVDKELEASMDAAIQVCALGHSARSAAGIKVRQPLPAVTVVANRNTLSLLQPVTGTIMEELNVKAVALSTTPATASATVRLVQGETMTVALDVTMTPDLLEEGLARDIVRHVQNQRKEMRLDVSDKVTVYYTAGPKLATAIKRHTAYISKETLAVELSENKPPAESRISECVLRGEKLRIGILLVQPAQT